jgi:importin subunit beta-1
MNADSVNASNFLEVVRLAFFDSNQETRSRHEAALTNCMSTDPSLFVTLCTEYFNNDETDLKIRITISTMLKLAIKPTKGNENLSIWMKISDETKTKVQETGLMNLVDDQDAIKNASASLVADVFACDCIFEKKWTTLLPNLRNNLNHEDANVQKSAILTLGYICEVLHQEKITSLTNEQVDAMITGICLGLKQYDEKTITALKALENSVNFLTESIKNESVSDFIMNLLITILSQATEAADLEVIRQTILCLTEICPLIYSSFQKYHQIVFQKIIEVMKVKNKEILLVYNEFFQAILKQELANESIRFLSQFVVSALEKILETLIFVLPEEYEFSDVDETVDVITSSLHVMTSMNTVYLPLTFDNLVEFIKKFIENQDEVSKSVALIALESMLEVPPNHKVQNILINVFFGVTSLFSKNNIRIKILTGSILAKIALFYPGIFMEDRNFSMVYPILMAQFFVPQKNFHVCKFVCKCIDNISENFSKLSPHAKSQFVINHETIIENLLNSVQDGNVTLYYIDLVYSSTMNLMQAVVPHENLSKWYIYFWKSFQEINPTMNDDLTRARIDSIFINLNIITQTIIINNKRLVLEENHNETLAEIFKVVISFFQNMNEIISEMLLFLVSMIELEAKFYQSYIEEFMREYLGRAIEQKTDPDLFQIGITCMGHLVKIYGAQMELYMVKLLPFMVSSLADPNMRKETKIHIFFAVADIAAHCPEATYTNLQDILNLLDMAFGAVVHLQEVKDLENILYVNNLKETLLDMILCIIHGIFYKEEQTEQTVLLGQFLPKVVQFIKMTTTPELNCNISYYRDSLMLLMDIYLKEKNSNLIDNNLILGLYRHLSMHNTYPDVQEILSEVRKYMYNNQDPLAQTNF